MTEQERIDFCALLLKRYGIQISPNNEILPILLSIADMETNVQTAIEKKLRNSSPQGKVIHITSGRHAIYYGLASWGAAAILGAITILILTVNYVVHDRQKSEFEHTKELYSAMQSDIERANRLGFLKSIDIKEDSKGRYFLLRNATGKNASEAGKDFYLIQDGKDLYAKIYTAYFK